VLNPSHTKTGERVFLPKKKILDLGRFCGVDELVLVDSFALAIKPQKKIHPIEKENHLNQTIIFRFYVNLRGCYAVF